MSLVKLCGGSSISIFVAVAVKRALKPYVTV